MLTLDKIAAKIKSVALGFEGVIENMPPKSNHISYFFDHQCLFYLKLDSKKITLGCTKGYLLEDKFEFTVSGKYMRHLYIHNEDEYDEALIKRYIDEAIICSIELNEKNRMRANLKRTK